MRTATWATGAAQPTKLPRPRRIPGVVIHVGPHPARAGRECYWVTHYGKLIAAPQRSFDPKRAGQPGALVEHATALIDQLFDDPYHEPAFRLAPQLAPQPAPALRLVRGGLDDVADAFRRAA